MRNMLLRLNKTHLLRTIAVISLLPASFCFSHFAVAQAKAKLTTLQVVEVNQLNAQEQVIDQLARRHLGLQVHRDKRDLDLLQRLADRKIIKTEETAKLQAMGVVLGKLLEKELKLKWMGYEDKVGYSRALCVPNTAHCLFPITMLSRRLEVGLQVNVKKIYANAIALIDPYIPDTNAYDGVKPDPTEKPLWIDDEDIKRKEPIKIRIQ